MSTLPYRQYQHLPQREDLLLLAQPCAVPDCFVRGVQLNSDNIFFLILVLVDEGREERIQLLLRAGHHRPSSDGPTLNAGLVALWFFRGSGPVLLRNHIALWFFRRWVGPLSPIWIRACHWSQSHMHELRFSLNPAAIGLPDWPETFSSPKNRYPNLYFCL